MGVLLGLLLGGGFACIWWSCWPSSTVPRRRSRWTETMRDTLVQAGVSGVEPAAVVGVSALAGLVVAVVACAAVPVAPIVVAFTCFGAGAPWLLLRGRARRRVGRLRQLWPDVVDHLASGVRAGLSLPEALSQLADRGPAELREPFAAFAADYRASGRFGESLDALKDRLADPVADRIVEALRLTRDVGGTDLGRLLRTLSAFLRDDLRTRGELEARQSWTVNSARLAAAAPWIVLATLASRHEAVQAFGTPAGALVLLLGAGCTVGAYLLMLRAARLPDDPRVLR
ncbi:type II secretion system F family protein [Cellulomonas sp. SG140]|uniref:type II secretion system F family protein n=1 Tax=Cellulomonas sp. SG140 TaxID=2976536 RepID=UPI0021E7BA92|nr:type II secretion system F family protein [Cellulomonas sp. SG140]